VEDEKRSMTMTREAEMWWRLVAVEETFVTIVLGAIYRSWRMGTDSDS
jgi:hypothetical protein